MSLYDDHMSDVFGYHWATHNGKRVMVRNNRRNKQMKLFKDSADSIRNNWTPNDVAKAFSEPSINTNTKMELRAMISVMLANWHRLQRVLQDTTAPTSAITTAPSYDASEEQRDLARSQDYGRPILPKGKYVSVRVTFDNSTFKSYTYKSWFVPEVGDRVIVEAPSTGLTMVTVQSVDKIMRDVSETYMYKWLVGAGHSIDCTIYASLTNNDAIMRNEREEMMRFEQRRKQRSDIERQIASLQSKLEEL